jgi:hypothetical protein
MALPIYFFVNHRYVVGQTQDLTTEPQALNRANPDKPRPRSEFYEDLVHNANANGLTWEQFDWRYARKKEAKEADESKKTSSVGGISRPFRPFLFDWPADHDHSSPAFNAIHRPHCAWKPFRRTGRPFHRGGDRPCDVHNKGQDLSAHHSLPADHRTLQAFFLRTPSEAEATWGDDLLLHDEESATYRAGTSSFLHGNGHGARRGGGHLYDDRLGNARPCDVHP